MKYEVIGNNYCKIFINNLEIKKVDFHNQDDLQELLKRIILKLKDKYKLMLKGLYQIIISVNKNIGSIIEIEQIETFLSSSKDIDLNIKVIFDCKFYFRTKDYSVVKDIKDVYYYKNNYFVDACKLKDVIKYIEFGDLSEVNEEDVEEFGVKVEKT